LKKKEDDKSTKSTKYEIKFFEGDHTYIITFSLKDESFVYLPKLKTGNKYLDIVEEPIEQDIVPLYNKLDIFLKALEKNDENNKKEKLYEDTIALYEQKKQFSLLITLFLKIYKESKNLCNKLIEIFYKVNEEENNDKINDLKKQVDSFRNIYSDSHNILEENKYNPIYFYGVLFCYLHYYDKDNFPKMIKEFSEGNSNTLYEILIQYYSHFMNPLKQNQNFYNNFVKYTLLKKKMDLDNFKLILNYIEDIETFLFVINSNIEEIFERYDELKTNPMKITSSLKLVKKKIENLKKIEIEKKEKKIEEDSGDEGDISEEDDRKGLDDVDKIENECDNIIKLIKGIIDFSYKERSLAIYLKSTFWINLIKEYNIPDWENINNIFKLRKIYKDYYNLVNKIYEDEPKDLNKKNKDSKNRNAIKDDINQYLERDEFAFMLDALIKKFFEENHDKISNAEILGTIAKFNPYFSVKDKEDKDKYKNNREVYIFDYVNFNRITEVFIKNFKSFNFEKMFEENITDYINKITSKIENIQTFGNIIKLINEKEIKEEKQKDYFRILEDKYKLIIKKDIISMKGEKELEKLIKIIAEFVSKLFLFYNDNRFLDEEISSMDDKIKSLIYIELITIYNQEEYKKQKDRIFEIYLEKIETEEGRENVIKLIQRLKDDDKKFFIYEKLLKKCQFTKDDFFSNYENYKIQTLCLLNKELKEESKNEDQKKEEGKDKKKEEQSNILNILEAQNGNEYAEYLVKILDKILKDLDKGAIVKKDLEKFLNIKRPKNVPQKFEEDPAIKEKGKEDENNNTNKVEENEYVKEKLELLTLIVSTYSPKTKYADYKSTIEKINENVELLKFIKDSLMIFHRNKYNDNIKQITIILDEIENSPVQKFKTEDTKKTIERLVEQRTLCDEIKKVKDFLLFKKIFENAQGIDQAERFEDATRKLVELKELFKNNSKNIEVIFNNEKLST